MNVLSLFDGMSCGQLALQRADIDVENYFACEIDKYAIQITQKNFPDTFQWGDVTKIKMPTKGSIDLLMGGSPCQGFSFAGHQLNFDDPRSRLFFDFVRILDAVKPKYVLLENVRMAKKSQDIMSEAMGFEPQALDSKWVSGQKRFRLYWWGKLVGDYYKQIPIPPLEDKGIVLADILEDLPFDEAPNYLKGTWCGRVRGDLVKSVDDDKAHCLTASMYKGQIPTFVKSKKPIQVGVANDIKGFDIIKRVYSPQGKSPTLTTMQGGHRQPKVAMDNLYRKLTPLECERLQTLPDNYTEGVSNTQRYKMIGNGWTVDVIAHILKGIKDV